MYVSLNFGIIRLLYLYVVMERNLVDFYKNKIFQRKKYEYVFNIGIYNFLSKLL